MAVCFIGCTPYAAWLPGEISKPAWLLQARVKALSEIVEQLVTSVSQNKDVDLNLIKKTASCPALSPPGSTPQPLTSEETHTSLSLHWVAYQSVMLPAEPPACPAINCSPLPRPQASHSVLFSTTVTAQVPARPPVIRKPFLPPPTPQGHQASHDPLSPACNLVTHRSGIIRGLAPAMQSFAQMCACKLVVLQRHEPCPASCLHVLAAICGISPASPWPCVHGGPSKNFANPIGISDLL